MRPCILGETEMSNMGAKYYHDYYLKHKAKRKSREIYRRYGITTAQFDRIFALQGKCCAICHRKKPTGKGWCIDHNHEIEFVRGILCSNCNFVLGLVGDKADLLRNAAEYLDIQFRS
jgi:hypothetical protein